jgi:predicted metal-dependent phosphoesterase TrpH
MKTIDLHTHSYASDGTFSPAEVIQRASLQGLSAVALTDHDTIAGLQEADAAAKMSKVPIELIPGIEFSTSFRDRELHIVGLGIHSDDSFLLQKTREIADCRLERNHTMLKRFQDAGFPLSWEDLTGKNPNAVITRAHFANALYQHNIVPSVKDAFIKYLDKKSPFYVNRFLIQPEDAIHIILQAQGIPILAHPFLYHLSIEELKQLLISLKKEGLAGMEVFYSTHTKNEEILANHLVREFGLKPSGGSDFHGTIKPDIEIGIGHGNLHIPYSIWENLKK